jgi:O-antigen/teichoic acid export membrane protein
MSLSVPFVWTRWLRLKRNNDDELADSSPSYRQIAGRSAGLWPAIVAFQANSRLDQALMIPLAGSVQLGLYAAAVTIAEVPSLFYWAIRDMVLPEATRRKDAQFIARIARISLVLTALAAASLALVTPLLVQLLFGSQYAGAVTPLRWLLLATIVPSFGNIVGLGLLAFDKPWLRSFIQMTGLGMTVIGILLFVPRFGANGAAIVSLVAYSVASIGYIVAFRFAGKLPFADMFRFQVVDWTWLFNRFRSTASLSGQPVST